MKSIVITGLIRKDRLRELCAPLNIEPLAVPQDTMSIHEFGIASFAGSVVLFSAINNQGMRQVTIQAEGKAADFTVKIFTGIGSASCFAGCTQVFTHEDVPLAELVK